MSNTHRHTTTGPEPAATPVVVRQSPEPRSADKRVYCWLCDWWSKNRNSWRSHVLYCKKHRERAGLPATTRFCAICGQDFTRNWNWRKHLDKPVCNPRRDGKGPPAVQKHELERIADEALAGPPVHALPQSPSLPAVSKVPTEDECLHPSPAMDPGYGWLNEYYVHDGSDVPRYVDMHNSNDFMDETGPAFEHGLYSSNQVHSNFVMDDMPMMHNLPIRPTAAFSIHNNMGMFYQHSSSNDMSTVALPNLDLFGPVLNNFPHGFDPRRLPPRQ